MPVTVFDTRTPQRAGHFSKMLPGTVLSVNEYLSVFVPDVLKVLVNATGMSLSPSRILRIFEKLDW